MNKEDFVIIQGDCLKTLKSLEDKSVRCCITSPPYYGLRDYGTGKWVGGDPNCNHYRDSKQSEFTATGHKHMQDCGQAIGDAIYKSVCPKCGAVRVDEQIGLEETPQEYINRLVDVFREIRRILKDDGTLWVNIGDTYAYQNSCNHNFDYDKGSGSNNENISKRKFDDSIKHKDLIGIPWLFAFAMRDDGWYLRQDIIWAKTNPMPESVEDRCTKSHEYIFLFSKSSDYYFDFESIQEDSIEDVAGTKFGGNKYGGNGEQFVNKSAGIYSGNEYVSNGKRRKRDVWFVGVNSYKGAHFATYPIELITPCVLAGSHKNDTILDPFSGSGTTGLVALANNRKYIGCELNESYIELSYKRLNEELFGVSSDNKNIKDEKYNKVNLIDF